MNHNPYKIPTPALVSFSGGRTSGFMLKQIIDAHNGNLPDDIYVVFANTGKEMPETLNFVRDCAKQWNCKIYWLELEIAEERPIYRTKEVNYVSASRNGEPFAALIERKKMLPNPIMRMCTQELKMNVMKRFMKSKGYKEWINVVGLRYDEPNRVAKQNRQNENNTNVWESVCPLYTDKIIIEDVSKFWINNNFDLHLRNNNGKTLAGNCDLCYLKGTKTLSKIVKEKPELADWWIEQESKINATFKKNMSYINLIDLSKLESKQIELFDDDSRSCFCHD
jgi:3'-phosphoadenosine 5'-phosphosulfate sulfotransferase (PAPS reductase)/FAD synthetase